MVAVPNISESAFLRMSFIHNTITYFCNYDEDMIAWHFLPDGSEGGVGSGFFQSSAIELSLDLSCKILKKLAKLSYP